MTDTNHNRIDLVRPDAPDLAQRGPLVVGVRTVQMVNRAQPDVLSVGAPLSDRHLTVEHWYPAMADTGRTAPYRALLRDGRTEVDLHGRALRGAVPLAGDFPLVILSHGFPGNRFLMSHLAEALAARGYHVASIDHTDSTYGDAAYQGGQAFGSTLVNRPLDTRFVMDQMGASRVAIVGYSMGGYGAMIAGGARLARAALVMEGASQIAPYLEQHCEAVADPRLKAIVAFGPWGRQLGLWDAAGMAAMSVPALIIAGSADTVSGYDTGMRLIFDEAVAVRRHLLTFDAAGHNAGAPIPAPVEAWQPAPNLDFAPFAHYGDAVWDTVRMNNISQHFVAAFLDQHLLGLDRGAYLSDGFAGFAEGSARGLRFETAGPLQGRVTV